jgi:hypothetical protein
MSFGDCMASIQNTSIVCQLQKLFRVRRCGMESWKYLSFVAILKRNGFTRGRTTQMTQRNPSGM